MSWPLVKLGDVAPAKAGKLFLSKSDDVWTLNLDQVEANTGKVLEKIIAPVLEAGSSTHGFDERHVLYSKLRPYLNKVVLPDERGLATTELVPMLPDPLRLDRKYLAYYLRSKSFVDWVSSQVAGAKMPRVSMQLFWQHEIPLPPLPEQKRIAAILDKADAIRRKRQQAIQLTDDFLRAVFLDIFGDPVTNPKGWEVKKLGEITKKITDGEHQNPEFISRGQPIVMARNVQADGVDFSNVKYISDADNQRFRNKCAPENGDVLLVGRGATIGRCCVVDSNIGFSLMGSVILIKPMDGVLASDFLIQFLKMEGVRNKMTIVSSSSAQEAIYLSHLKNILVLVPRYDLQVKFSLVRKKTLSLLKIEETVSDIPLFESLSQKAFRGEL